MSCPYQKDKKIQNTTKNVWWTKIEISDDYNAYQTKFSNMLSEFEHMLDGRLGLIEAA